VASNFFAERQAALERKYLEDLTDFKLRPGGGAMLRCPFCGQSFYVALPEHCPDRAVDALRLSCAAACGHVGEIPGFSPQPHDSTLGDFDTVLMCRCGNRSAANGVVLRCPFCHIENPRNVMANAVKHIESRLSGDARTSRIELEHMASFLVSAFDGVMRSMLRIANENARRFRQSDCAHAFMANMNALPASLSFQNLTAARDRLQPAGFIMDGRTQDFARMLSVFNKRHLIAHRLGVVDQDYLDRTNDPAAEIGKKVPLTAEEILEAAAACQRTVNSFFGGFLS
jgi:hypothetical protein